MFTMKLLLDFPFISAPQIFGSSSAPTESYGAGKVHGNNPFSSPWSLSTEFLEIFPIVSFLMDFFPQRGQKDLLIQSLHVTDRKTETRLVKFLPGLRMICINIIVIKRPMSHYLMTRFQDWHSKPLISYSLFLISLVCPRGWDLHEGRCFFLSTSELSWNKSRDFCEAEGSSLAIVNTPAKLVRALEWCREAGGLLQPPWAEMGQSERQGRGGAGLRDAEAAGRGAQAPCCESGGGDSSQQWWGVFLGSI